jgi:hypothetical protein
MIPVTYDFCFEGGFLKRGFWLYIWEVAVPGGQSLFYVGRTGDSSSVNAQSPFNRMGQHLGFAPNSSMLRRHLCARGVEPEHCSFRLVAHGPIFEEAKDRDGHYERRDIVAALEKALAEAMCAAGYDVMNTVRCVKPLGSKMFADVRAAFAADFPALRDGAGAEG